MFPKENYQCWNAIEICSNFFKNFIKEWWSFTKKKTLHGHDRLLSHLQFITNDFLEYLKKTKEDHIQTFW